MTNHSMYPSTPLPIVEYGDNFIPVILVDYLEHTIERPFCWDRTCPCHQDREALEQVNQDHRNGLCTLTEALRIVKGEQIC